MADSMIRVILVDTDLNVKNNVVLIKWFIGSLPLVHLHIQISRVTKLIIFFQKYIKPSNFTYIFQTFSAGKYEWTNKITKGIIDVHITWLICMQFIIIT